MLLPFIMPLKSFVVLPLLIHSVLHGSAEICLSILSLLIVQQLLRLSGRPSAWITCFFCPGYKPRVNCSNQNLLKRAFVTSVRLKGSV